MTSVLSHPSAVGGRVARPRGYAALRERIPRRRRRRCDAAAVLGRGAVSDGRHVVLPAQAVRPAAALADRGFLPAPVDLSELLLGGSGPKCCTLEVRP